MYSQKISITLPEKLVSQIEALAAHMLTSRSDIIRLAVMYYLEDPKHQIEYVNESQQVTQVKVKDDYADILARHLTADPNDIELLQFFREQGL